MKSILGIVIITAKVFAVISMLAALAVALVWLDHNDFYDSDYRDLTETEMAQFEWKDTYDAEGRQLKKAFITQFKNKEFEFPRQRVNKIKLFRHIPALGIFTGTTLKQEQADSVLRFCNDPTNFDWGESTWDYWDGEYVLKFYNEGGSIVGKIFVCLKGCGMTSARPFSPRMKFEQLSNKGENEIIRIIHEIYGKN